MQHSARLSLVLAASAAAFLAASEAGSAAVLVQYSVPAAGDQQAPTTVSSSVSATDFLANAANSNVIISPESVGYTTGSGGISPSGDGAYRVVPNNVTVTSTDEASSLSSGAFAFFTLTANSGSSFNLSTLTFNIARGGGSTPRGFNLRSSADNYASDLLGTGNGDIGSQRPAWTGETAILGAPFQGISAVTFRFYTYAPAAGSSLDMDDITVNGTVVPEPTSAISLSLGALGLMARRRRVA